MEPAGVVGGVPPSLVPPPLPPPPPPPPASPIPIRVGGVIPGPRKLKDVEPVYPQVAIAARVEGTVILEATVDAEGRVIDVQVLRSVPLLDAAAVEAARQWVYSPTLLEGVPVAVVLTATVTFSLR